MHEALKITRAKDNQMMLRTRKNVTELQEELERHLNHLQSKDNGICPKRETLYANIFVRLIRQVNEESPESGALLTNLRNERRMTLACHLELHRDATELGIKESILADSAVYALSERHDDLVTKINALKLKAATMNHEIRLIEDTAAQALAVEDRVKAKQIEALQWSRHHLSHKPGSDCAQQ